MSYHLRFDSVAEALPGPKWQRRWQRSWPDYRSWFVRSGGLDGPDRKTCEAALARYMPELEPVHRRLTTLAGGGDDASRFLSTWRPPTYLGGCSVAALSRGRETSLIRNYDLSPNLNEGLLLRSEWTGKPVMGMVEFLWGLSDGINADGLAVALAFGGMCTTDEGFGICTILRYVLETCRMVDDALKVLDRVPSHMDYNLVLADADGRTRSVEMHAGGGMTERTPAIATNHQLDAPLPDRATFTRTVERRAALAGLASEGDPGEAALMRFLDAPLHQSDYANGFGTLFTAAYEPARREMRLVWPGERLHQTLDGFDEGSRSIEYASGAPIAVPSLADLVAAVPASRRSAAERWVEQAEAGEQDWAAFGMLFVEPSPSVSRRARHFSSRSTAEV